MILNLKLPKNKINDTTFIINADRGCNLHPDGGSWRKYIFGSNGANSRRISEEDTIQVLSWSDARPELLKSYNALNNDMREKDSYNQSITNPSIRVLNCLCKQQDSAKVTCLSKCLMSTI